MLVQKRYDDSFIEYAVTNIDLVPFTTHPRISGEAKTN
jgi:hypothetical protein